MIDGPNSRIFFARKWWDATDWKFLKSVPTPRAHRSMVDIGSVHIFSPWIPRWLKPPWHNLTPDRWMVTIPKRSRRNCQAFLLNNWPVHRHQRSHWCFPKKVMSGEKNWTTHGPDDFCCRLPQPKKGHPVREVYYFKTQPRKTFFSAGWNVDFPEDDCNLYETSRFVVPGRTPPNKETSQTFQRKTSKKKTAQGSSMKRPKTLCMPGTPSRR